jgi:uncharacterized protein YbdZ (MbtH family)
LAIAANIIIIWPSTAASIPSGWSRETALDAKYPKGAAAAADPGGTGGALTHTHTSQSHTHTTAHTHTVPNSPAGSGATARDTGTTNPADTHTHGSNPSTTNPTTATAGDTPTTDAINHEPPFFTVIFIKSDGTPLGIPNAAITLWNDNIDVPPGWALADGGGGRPDLRNKFIKGAAAAGDGGSTGGATTHSHTLASHTHSTPYAHGHPDVTSSTTASGLVAGSISGANVGTATSAHTHTLTIGSTSPAITGSTDATGTGANEPPYLQQAFIHNGRGNDELPRGIIAIWIGTLAAIPDGWNLCDGSKNTPDLRSQFVKGANTLSDIRTAAGSLTHTHTPTGHTHPIASHTHTVTAAAGAGENRTAGSTNAATTAHTHPSWSATGASSLTSGSSTPTVDNQTDTQPPYYAVAFVQYAPALQWNNFLHSRADRGNAGIISFTEKIR